MKGRSVLMMVRSDVAHDARVLREAATLAHAGWRVRVLGIWAAGLARRESVEGFEVLRPRSRLMHGLVRRQATSAPRAAAGRPSPLRLWLNALASSLDGALFGLQAAREALRGGRPDVVHAHDLNVLPAAWLVSRLYRARLVYDSHEVHLFSIGMLRMRPPAWRALCRRIERFCARGADAVITVNRSCARALARIHRIARPLELYNTPRLSELAREARSVRAAAGVPADAPLAVHCGGMLPQRGLEQAISALAAVPELKLALLGFGEAGYVESLKRHAAQAGVAGRVLFVPPVRPDEVTAALRGADMSLVLTQNAGLLNHRVSLPNKLIESLHAGVPVIATDLPEIRRVVRTYGCGLVVDARDPAAIAAAMREMTQKPSMRAAFAAATRAAARELNWEKEEQVLLGAYRVLGGAGTEAGLRDVHSQQ